MAYLVSRSIAFGSYAAPRRPRRRPVRFAGHYNLGDAASDFCIPIANARIPPVLRAKWLQACITAYQQQRPAAPPAPGPAPIVAPIVAPPGTPAPYAGTYAGTPVPVGFSTSQIYVDLQGNQWMFDPASGTWKNATAAANAAAITSEQAQAAQIAAATATSPAGGPAPILVTSPTLSPYLPQQGAPGVSVSVSPSGGYSDILNWLSESTLISPIPNWILLAGGGLLAMKLSGKKGLL